MAFFVAGSDTGFVRFSAGVPCADGSGVLHGFGIPLFPLLGSSSLSACVAVLDSVRGNVHLSACGKWLVFRPWKVSGFPLTGLCCLPAVADWVRWRACCHRLHPRFGPWWRHLMLPGPGERCHPVGFLYNGKTHGNKWVWIRVNRRQIPLFSMSVPNFLVTLHFW